MAGVQGRITRDLFGGSLHILGKLIIDSNNNLYVANTYQENAHVNGGLYVNTISEKTFGQGIKINGNVTISDGHVLKVDIVDANTFVGTVTFDTLYAQNIVTEDIFANIVSANTVIATSVTGNTFGIHVGDVIGNTFGSHVGNVFGNVFGNVYGNIFGEFLGNIKTNQISPQTGNIVNVLGNIVIGTPGSSLRSDIIFVDNIIEYTSMGGVDVTGNLVVSGIFESIGNIFVSNNQVVGPRQSSIPFANGTSVGNVSATCNALIQVLRVHGLIW